MLDRIRKRIADFLLTSPLRYTRTFTLLERTLARMPIEKMSEVVFEFAAVQKLEGDYLEFGVFQGASFVRAWHCARMFGLHAMRFYAFDSFGGLPPIQGGDMTPACIFSEGGFSCSREEFEKNIRNHRVDQRRVEIIPGWFSETLTPETRTELPIKKAAIAWIDCDLYESTVPALDFIVPYLQDGTILMFDDWFAFKGRPDLGQPRALAEWLARNPGIRTIEYRQADWASKAFIVHLCPAGDGTPAPQK